MSSDSNDNTNVELQELLERLCKRLKDSRDSLYAADSVNDLLEQLEIQLQYLKQNGQVKSITAIKFLLLPTNSLQDISIDNGWGDEFVTLADAIESLLE